jgi:hypothetical protein
VSIPYSQPPPGPASRVRPATVTISSYLLLVVAGVTLITAVISLSTIGTVTKVYRDAYRGSQLEGVETIAIVSSVAGAVVNVLFAVGLVVLALLNNRGRNPSRIVTWVVGGLSLCCTSVALGGTAVSGSFTMSSGGSGGPDPAELQRRLQAALPGWYMPVNLTLSALSLVVMIVALILLALPASNEFFRKAPPGWSAGPTYPAYPTASYPPPAGPAPDAGPVEGLPAHPGQGGQHPGQPYPGQPYPGQQYPGQPYPGQAGQPSPDPQPGGPRRPEDPPPA